MEARCLSEEIFLWKQRGDAKPVTTQRRLGPRLENSLENASAETWGDGRQTPRSPSARRVYASAAHTSRARQRAAQPQWRPRAPRVGRGLGGVSPPAL